MKKIEKVTGSFLSIGGVVMLDLDDQGTVTLQDKINELIDYLLDKEDPEQIIKAYNDLLDRQHEGEASKGEYPFQHDFEPDKNGKCWCNIPKESGYHTNPPQQEECPKCGKKMVGMYCCDLSSQEALDILKDVKPEESMGECLTCGKPVRSGSTKEVCVCPERKPDGSWKPQLKEESPKEDEKENQPQPDSKVEMVRMDLVNKHYVSKVKIKDVLRDVKDGGEFYTRQAVNEIFEKLGLKEL